MAFPIARDPNTIPAHVLFPEEYEASKRMVARDLALLASFIAGAVIGCAFFFTQ